jgi:hypothetical protein
MDFDRSEENLWSPQCPRRRSTGSAWHSVLRRGTGGAVQVNGVRGAHSPSHCGIRIPGLLRYFAGCGEDQFSSISGAIHVVLEADEAVMKGRINADEIEGAARPWRLDHLPTYADARRWLATRADLMLDTTDMTPDLAAQRIWEAALDRMA